MYQKFILEAQQLTITADEIIILCVISTVFPKIYVKLVSFNNEIIKESSKYVMQCYHIKAFETVTYSSTILGFTICSFHMLSSGESTYI